MRYATRCTYPAVTSRTILPAWMRGAGPSPGPSPVGLTYIWGRAMYPELAALVDTPIKRKSKAPHPTVKGAPGSRAVAVGVVLEVHRSHKSDGS